MYRQNEPNGRPLGVTVALSPAARKAALRSSRGIERQCRDDVAFRVVTANQAPDHATIARFRVRHEQAISGLFGEVLALCAKAGLVQVGVVAVDGTKIAAAATERATRSSRIRRDADQPPRGYAPVR